MDASSWFRDTITVQSPTGLAASGSSEQTWGAQRAVLCRYNSGQRKVERTDGSVVFTIATIRCTEEITVHDRVWPPGADVTKTSASRKPVLATSVTNKQGYRLFRVEI